MHPDCPDFDLCAACEALPIAIHPTLHPMLKMKSSDTIVPTVYRVGATELIPPVRRQECHPTRSPSPTTVQASSRSSSPVAVPGAFLRRRSGWSSTPHTNPVVGMPRNPFTPSLCQTPFESRADSPVASPPESEVAEEDNTDTEMAAPSVEASSSRFMLPPLALDPTSDLFREFWPRVAQELRMLMQESSNASPQVNTGSSPQVGEVQHKVAEVKSNQEKARNDMVAGAPVPLGQSLARLGMDKNHGSVTADNHSLTALVGYQSPSPAVSSPLATSLSSLNEKDDTAAPKTRLACPAEGLLSASFLSNTTVPDGQLIPPGAEFVKSWRMVNDGDGAWPDNTELVFVAGERMAQEEGVPQKIKIGPVQSQSEVDIWTGELKVKCSLHHFRHLTDTVRRPQMPLGGTSATGDSATERGTSLDKAYGSSVFFSCNFLSDTEPSLISITVAELSHCTETSSLASSSIVMPQSAPVRSAAPSEVAVLQQTVSMSPVTAASRLTTDYAASDNGSDASSVSLVSVSPSISCSEEAEWEEAEWEDSRSQVMVSQPDGSRAGMEYVVLYDENSSDEE